MQGEGPEPWLRGNLPGVHPLWMPLYHSFQQVREDLRIHVAGLPAALVWQPRPGGALGFHLQHMAGSVDRLSTYVGGDELNDEQMNFLRHEAEGTDDAATLVGRLEAQLEKAEERVASLDPADPFARRTVGRQKLPTTVLGLVVHLAEHTQRHLGQSITIARDLQEHAQDGRGMERATE